MYFEYAARNPMIIWITFLLTYPLSIDYYSIDT